jgi:hypothetical protein
LLLLLSAGGDDFAQTKTLQFYSFSCAWSCACLMRRQSLPAFVSQTGYGWGEPHGLKRECFPASRACPPDRGDEVSVGYQRRVK